VFVAHETK